MTRRGCGERGWTVAFRLAVLVFVLAAATAVRAADVPRDSIDKILDAPPFDRATWGVLIEDGSGRVLYARNPDRLFVPASVRKLFAASWIVGCRNLDSTIPTDIEVSGHVVDGILDGDLVVRGHGDPSLGGRYWTDRDRSLEPILAMLRSRGIRAIHGRVVADVSAFDRDMLPGGWKYQNIGSSWAQPVDALVFNENVVGVLQGGDCAHESFTTDPTTPVVGSDEGCGEGDVELHVDDRNRIVVERGAQPPEDDEGGESLLAISDPGLWTAQGVADFLRRSGIPVTEDPAEVDQPVPDAEVIGSIESPTLSTLLGTTLEDSVNLFAEELYKGSSQVVPGPASYKTSEALERSFLVDEVGLDPASFSFNDGSGLSVEDLVAPRAVVDLIDYLLKDGRRQVFEQLLAHPGVGTLRTRLLNFAGRLHAKTGTLNGVDALAGWLTMPNGGLLRFAFFVNHHTAHSSEARARIDSVLTLVAQ